MLGIAAALRQPSRAMRADVVAGLDRGRVGADDDDRLVDDVIGDVVADLGDLFETTRDLPHVRPQMLGLEPRELGAVIDLFRDEVITDFVGRSEEHTSELQSLMRISYAVFCLKKKKKKRKK